MSERNPANPARTNDRSETRERANLVLIKGDHRWHFCWEPGGEGAIINHVADLARRPDMPFDWFDAAAICTCVVQPGHASCKSENRGNSRDT